MASPFRVELVTPERTVYSSDEATMVSVRSIAGDLAFMAGHIPYVGALLVAPVKFISGTGEVEIAAVHGGIAHFRPEGTLVISAGVAELKGEIDVDRARRSLEESEDPDSHEQKRAVLRLEVAGVSI